MRDTALCPFDGCFVHVGTVIRDINYMCICIITQKIKYDAVFYLGAFMIESTTNAGDDYPSGNSSFYVLE